MTTTDQPNALSGPPAVPDNVLLIRSSLGYYCGFNMGIWVDGDSTEPPSLHLWGNDPKEAVQYSTGNASDILLSVQKEVPDAHLVIASVSWQRIITITG